MEWVIYYNKDYQYNEGYEFDAKKAGKWMYFFQDKEYAAQICKKAIEENIIQECKHNNSEQGVVCFYLNYEDIATHKKVITYFLENNLIRKTKAGRLYNISFKLDNQTRAGEYGADYSSEIKLSNFMNLDTGEWLI